MTSEETKLRYLVHQVWDELELWHRERVERVTFRRNADGDYFTVHDTSSFKPMLCPQLASWEPLVSNNPGLAPLSQAHDLELANHTTITIPRPNGHERLLARSQSYALSPAL